MISMLACAVIWVICIITISVAAEKLFIVCILAILLAPLYILCLAGTLKCLPAATPVPVKEKRRIVGAVVLLFLNYFVMISPMIVLIFHIRSYMLDHIQYIITHTTDVIMALFLLSPFADLILFVFMCDWFTDKLVASLCCCIKDVSTPSTVWLTVGQVAWFRQREGEAKYFGNAGKERKLVCKQNRLQMLVQWTPHGGFSSLLSADVSNRN